jgi:DNA-binding transcriptional regulator YiaG
MTDRCTNCGGTVETTILPEHVEDIGGFSVLLRNAVIQTRCKDCSEEMTAIPDEDALYRAAALARVMIPVQLGAREVRFLRNTLEMTQAEFAEAVGIGSAETISRWENGVRGHGAFTEKSIRYGVYALLHKRVPAADYDSEAIARMQIRTLPEGRSLAPLVFERVIVKHDHTREDAWDAAELPMAA